eukprot:scaffold120260_cov62-Attheya_sp.AAC.1
MACVAWHTRIPHAYAPHMMGDVQTRHCDAAHGNSGGPITSWRTINLHGHRQKCAVWRGNSLDKSDGEPTQARKNLKEKVRQMMLSNRAMPPIRLTGVMPVTLQGPELGHHPTDVRTVVEDVGKGRGEKEEEKDLSEAVQAEEGAVASILCRRIQE